jgi:hypothetical protein
MPRLTILTAMMMAIASQSDSMSAGKNNVARAKPCLLPVMARLGPARLHLGIPLIEAMALSAVVSAKH